MESILTQVTKGTKSSADGVHTRFLDETEVTSLTPSLTPPTVAPQLDLALAQMRLHELGVPREDMNEDDAARVILASIRGYLERKRKWVKHDQTRIRIGGGGGAKLVSMDKEAAIEYMLQEPTIIGLCYNLNTNKANFKKTTWRACAARRMDTTNTFHKGNPNQPGQKRGRRYTWHVVYLKKLFI